MERNDTGRADDPLIGRVLDGRYRVGPKIARGGMATVYEATDLRLDRTVAVKIMHAGISDDPEFVARFEREARSAARLAHHNVVAVFDQGEDHGTLFLVMEYVPGLTLRDMIRKEAPMSPSKTLSVIEPILSALAAAHGAGMIHRDVKPENVLLADDGRIKVADFGLARAVNAETQHTATGGVLIGTVSYLAPELVIDGKADARSDVYAVGVLLYEMLTGVKPHQADSPIQVAYKHVHEDIPAPSLRVPGIPAYVDALVARATARDQAMRPADATVLLHQVRRVRQALDHGVVEDAGLTADLHPTGELPITDPDTDLTAPVAARGAVAEDVYNQDLDLTTAVAPAPGLDTPPPVLPAPPGPPRKPRPAGPKRSRRGPIMLAALLVAALLVGLGGWYLGIARYTVTPGVIGTSTALAQAKIEKAGLDFKVGSYEYSETFSKGSVTRTDPSPGSRINKGGTVSVVVSKGPERHRVPDARGMTLDQAQALLTKNDLTIGQVKRQYDEQVAAGQVIELDPPAGTELKRNAAVNIYLSRGKKPIDIPNWTGRYASNAKLALVGLGFKVNREDRYDDTIPDGRIITQSPSSGIGHRGDTISLVVSRGPELVQLPGQLKGLRVQDARRELRELGFAVKVQRSIIFVGAQYVVDSDPAAGSMARKGSTVTLTIV